MDAFSIAILPPLSFGDDPGPLARALCRALPGAVLALPGGRAAACDLVYDLAPSADRPHPTGLHAGLFQPLRTAASDRPALAERARQTDLVITPTPEDQAWLLREGINALLIAGASSAPVLRVGLLTADNRWPETLPCPDTVAGRRILWAMLSPGQDPTGLDLLICGETECNPTSLAQSSTVRAALLRGLPVLVPIDDRTSVPDGITPFRPGDGADLASHLTRLCPAVTGRGMDTVVTDHLAAFRALLADPPARPGLPPAAPAVRLLTHGAEARGETMGGPSLRVPATARLLRAQGIHATADVFSGAARISEGIVHLFNVWEPTSALAALRALKDAGKRVVFSPIYLDFTERDFWEFELPLSAPDAVGWPAILGAARRHAAGRGRWHEAVPGYHAMLREMIALADRVVLLSEAERRALQAIGAAVGPDRADIIRNAVDLDIWQPGDPEQFRAAWLQDRPGPQDYIITVGRIEPRKNQLMLARAMRDLPLQLVAVGHEGDPAYAARLRDAAGDQLLHIPRLDPASPMLRAALQGARGFALPSWSEGASLAALEAAAMGCPLLLADRGAEREYYGDLAHYADPGDPEALRAGLERMLAEGRSGNVASDRAATLRSHLAQYNDPTVHAATLARLYAGLAASAPASAPSCGRTGGAATELERTSSPLLVDVTALTGNLLEDGDLTGLLPQAAIRIRHMPGTSDFEALPDAGPTEGLSEFLASDGALFVLAPQGVFDPAHGAALSDLRARQGLHLVGVLNDPVAVTAPWRLPAEGVAGPETAIRRLLELADTLILPSSDLAQDLAWQLQSDQPLQPRVLSLPPLATPLSAAIPEATDDSLTWLEQRIAGRVFVVPATPLQARYNIGLVCRIWQALAQNAAQTGEAPPLLVLPGAADSDSGPIMHRMKQNPQTAPHVLIPGAVSAAGQDWLLRHALFTLCPAEEATGQMHTVTSLNRGRPCIAAPAALPEGWDGMKAGLVPGPEPQDLAGWVARVRAQIARQTNGADADITPAARPPDDRLTILQKSLKPNRHRPFPIAGGTIPAGPDSWRAGLIFGPGWHAAKTGTRRMAEAEAVLHLDCRALLRGGSREIGVILQLDRMVDRSQVLTITQADHLAWDSRSASLPEAVILRLPAAACDTAGLLTLTLRSPQNQPGEDPAVALRGAGLFDPVHDNPLGLLAPAEIWADGSGPVHMDLARPDHRRILAGNLTWNPARGLGSATGRFALSLPVLPGAPFNRITIEGRAAAGVFARLHVMLNGVAVGQADLAPDASLCLDFAVDPALFSVAAPAVLAAEITGDGSALPGSDGIAGAAFLSVSLFPREDQP